MLGLVGFAASSLMTLIAGLGLPPSAAAGHPAQVIAPVRPCADLVGRFDIAAATTQVTAATQVPASAGEPAHCEVRGQIEPAVRFQLRLPTTTYSGRYLPYGCLAYCGEIPPTPFPACGGSRGGDVAVAGSDDGHLGQPPIPFLDGTWAADNQPARNDFFFRAPHVVSRRPSGSSPTTTAHRQGMPISKAAPMAAGRACCGWRAREPTPSAPTTPEVSGTTPSRAAGVPTPSADKTANVPDDLSGHRLQ